MVSGSKLKVAGALSLLGGALALGQGCKAIVGIEETTLEEPGGASGGSGKGGGGGTGGDSSGGKGASGGSGGMSTTGGASGSGTSGGSAGKGGSTGGDAGKGGAGGSGGSSSGGDAGSPDGGTSSGSAGTGQGGMPATGGSAGSGTGGLPGDCAGTESRCTSAGERQTCTDGVFVDDPCPLDSPTCSADVAGGCTVRGPELIQVGDYYIDATEVTVAQYQEFLDAKNGDTGGQSGLCGWNDDYEPSDNPGPDDWPIAYVDWCDATAYCKWADKHLCGRLDGEDLTPEELLLANDSQWFRACGGPSGSPHPNGDPVCNTSDGFDTTAPVASFPGCEGYYPGIFDMEGNVSEWVDLCVGPSGASDTCYALGGSSLDDKSYCTRSPEEIRRDATYYSVGFRCCSG